MIGLSKKTLTSGMHRVRQDTLPILPILLRQADAEQTHSRLDLSIRRIRLVLLRSFLVVHIVPPRGASFERDDGREVDDARLVGLEERGEEEGGEQEVAEMIACHLRLEPFFRVLESARNDDCVVDEDLMWRGIKESAGVAF